MNPNMLMQILPLLQNNPIGMAQQHGFNIPEGQNMGSPKDMVQYLMQSGQIDQNAFNQAVAFAKSMGYNV